MFRRVNAERQVRLCQPPRILKEEVHESPSDDAEFSMRIHLKFTGEPDEMEDDDDEDFAAETTAEWGSIGFMFVLAVLSFAEAKPRNLSEIDYLEKDDLSLSDFMERLRFVSLRYTADYIRGRRIKTTITVRPDGTVTVDTLGRGKSALRRLERLQGKKLMRGRRARVTPGGSHGALFLDRLQYTRAIASSCAQGAAVTVPAIVADGGVVAGSADGAVRVWDLNELARVRKTPRCMSH